MIAVLDYGIGNLRSAEKALQKVGADARLVTSPAAVEAAEGVVLPGVGALGRCMEAQRETGRDGAATAAIDAGTPFMGISIGIQMLYDGSEENPETRGLGVLPGTVRELPEGVKRPQMQWNILQPVISDSPMLAGLDKNTWVYFVHSYAPDASDEVVATCDYGGSVVAAVARRNVWATQFHPEKSGAAGLRILRNFVDRCGPT